MLKKMLIAGAAACLFSTGVFPTAASAAPAQCGAPLPDAAQLKTALTNAVASAHAVNRAVDIGFLLDMWATVVAKDGTVCAVAYSGGNAIDGQWLLSRVISAQKANTANDLSLGVGNGPAPIAPKGFAISTATLYSATQPGGSLFGLQHSNPVWSAGAYGDRVSPGGVFTGPANTAAYGTPSDPMVGQVIGGVNLFGGGLGLYDAGHKKVGGVGVSGDTSCMDHIVAWFLRKNLGLDNLKPIAGFALYATPADAKHPDNIIFDITANPNGGTGISQSAYGHPVCKGASGVTLDNATANSIVRALPAANVK